jgi:hypothetical protein
MATNWKDAPIHEYMVSKCAYAEGGYNYYLYVHALGQVIVLREKIEQTEYLYADGGTDKTTSWTNRAILEYKYYDLIG